MKPFADFYKETFMVLEASGGCVNQLFMVWNLQEVAVKPVADFCNEIPILFWKLQEAAVNPLLMIWNLEEVAVKPFAYFYNELFNCLEAAGRCCESIIDGSESLGGCCEAICTLLQRNINGFGSFRRLLRIHY